MDSFLLVLLTAVSTASFTSATVEVMDVKTYQVSELCPGNMLSQAFKTDVFQTRGKIECAAKCGQRSYCKSWEFHKNGSQCELGMQVFNTDCANTEPTSADRNVTHYDNKNFCFNAGHMTTEEGGCLCPNATWGTRCELIMRDCYDWRRVADSTVNALYWVQPVGAIEPFQVWCRLGGVVPRLYLIEHIDNNVDFNRTWEDYKNGFGVPGETSFWIGLDKLHLVTLHHRRSLTIKVTLMNGENEYWLYKDFKVGDEVSGYQWSFEVNRRSQSNNSMGECFGDLNGARFSTWDRDNDMQSPGQGARCAKRFGGGFWYKNDTCSVCNPMGFLDRPADGVFRGPESNAFWVNASGLHAFGEAWGPMPIDGMHFTLFRADD